MGVTFREEDCLIQDNQGKSYRVQFFENPGVWCFIVYDGDVPIGHANCVLKRDILIVEDLHVSADATTPAHGLPLLFRNLFHYASKGISYRSRGLGTAMLHLVISRASQLGFNLVEANLSPHDLAEDPTLPEWYCRRGFALVPAGGYGKAKVQLQVRSGSGDGGARAFAS